MNRFLDILQPANMIDVLVGTCFIYAVIWWLRQSTSPRLAYQIVLAGFVLAVLFATARRFEMVLMETVADTTFLLVGLGTAVFFQENTQRTLDRFLSMGSRQYSSDKKPPLLPVQVICEAIGGRVGKSYGALIPIRGKDSWSRQIDGGVRLEGMVLSVEDPMLGTRYAAGLGLSELCHAFIIVVRRPIR